MELTAEQKTALKGKGYIEIRGENVFACRVVAPAGKLTAEQAKKVAEVSEKYGKGAFYFTQRLNIEIPWVAYENLEALTEELAQVGLRIGSAGKKVKPAHTCKAVYCKMALADVEGLALRINERFCAEEVKLPSKLRISIAGCLHNCSSPQLSCIGIQSKKKDKYAISLGGNGARKQIFGTELEGLFAEEEVISLLDKAINLYQEKGNEGERFSAFVERVGMGQFTI